MESAYYSSDLSEELGRGSFSSVYVGYNKKDKNIKVAVKEIKNDLKQGGHFSESAKKEFFALQKVCGHANIVELLDFHSSRRFIYLIIELCNLGDLEIYARNNTLTLKEKLDIMKQCANGVNYLHSLDPVVVHRDLKPQNILLKKTPEGDVVKITDFGLAKVIENREQFYMSTDAGTPIYRAPELFRQGRLQYTSAVDVFSLGLVFVVLYNYDGDKCTTFEPYDNPNEPFIVYGLKLQLCSKKHEEFPNLLNLKSDDSELVIDIKSLITKMTNIDDKDRIKMKRVVSELDIIKDKTENKFATSHTELNVKILHKNAEIERTENQLSELKTEVRAKKSKIIELEEEVKRLQSLNQELLIETSDLIANNSHMPNQTKTLTYDLDKGHSKSATNMLSSHDRQLDKDRFVEISVHIQRQENGYGFRMIGGLVEGSPVSIGRIVPGGAAYQDGKLRCSDEIIQVEDVSVIGCSHHKVVQLISQAGKLGHLNLTVRRRLIGDVE